MTLPSLKARWREGDAAIGAWLVLSEPILAGAAADAGYDYVVVDLHHGIGELTAMASMVSTIAHHGSVPVVALPSLDPGLAGRALDAGATALVVPDIETAADAERIVRAARYAGGSRSWGATQAGALYGGYRPADADDAVSIICALRSPAAIEQAERIAAVGGVDALYVWPAELAVSHGLGPDDAGHPVVEEAVVTVAIACARQGKAAGVHAVGSGAATRLDQGFRMITAAEDHSAALAGLAGAIDGLR